MKISEFYKELSLITEDKNSSLDELKSKLAKLLKEAKESNLDVDVDESILTPTPVEEDEDDSSYEYDYDDSYESSYDDEDED